MCIEGALLCFVFFPWIIIHLLPQFSSLLWRPFSLFMPQNGRANLPWETRGRASSLTSRMSLHLCHLHPSHLPPHHPSTRSSPGNPPPCTSLQTCHQTPRSSSALPVSLSLWIKWWLKFVLTCSTEFKQDLLSRFSETHRTVLNQILRQSTTHLADGPFAVLVDYIRILDFDVKRK